MHVSVCLSVCLTCSLFYIGDSVSHCPELYFAALFCSVIVSLVLISFVLVVLSYRVAVCGIA